MIGTAKMFQERSRAFTQTWRDFDEDIRPTPGEFLVHAFFRQRQGAKPRNLQTDTIHPRINDQPERRLKERMSETQRRASSKVPVPATTQSRDSQPALSRASYIYAQGTVADEYTSADTSDLGALSMTVSATPIQMLKGTAEIGFDDGPRPGCFRRPHVPIIDKNVIRSTLLLRARRRQNSRISGNLQLGNGLAAPSRVECKWSSFCTLKAPYS